MNSRRFAIKAAALCGTLIPVGCVIVAVAAFDFYNTKNNDASSIDKPTTEAVSAVSPMTDSCRGLVAQLFAARSAHSRRSRW